MSPLLRRRFLALALAVLVTAGACGGGGAGSGSKAAGSSSGNETTTTNADGSTAASTGDASSGSTTKGGGTKAKPSGSAADSASGATGGTTPEDLGPERTDIPAAGRYTYKYTPTGKSASDKYLDVHDGGDRRGDVRQLLYFGSGSTVTAKQVVWLGTSKYYVEAEQRARETEQAALCAWDPGLVELELPLAVGKSWKGDSSCAADGSTKRRTVDASIKRSDEAVIGGRKVQVFVLERTVVTTSVTKGTNVTVTTEDRDVTTDLVSADRHLLVRSEGTSTSTLNGAPKGATGFTLVLTALDPKPIPGPKS
jgi:hypothetical protein